MIANRDHLPLAFVGDDHCELTSQKRRGLYAALLIKVQRNLAVAVGGKVIAARPQPLANLAVTVEFAVHHHVHRAIRAGHGLTAVPQTDDRQTRVPERPLPITRRPEPGAVRSAMLQKLERCIGPVTRKPVPRHRGEYPTHRCVLRHGCRAQISERQARSSTMTPPNWQRCLFRLTRRLHSAFRVGGMTPAGNAAGGSLLTTARHAGTVALRSG
jgi:hypothetical protein